MTEILQGMSAQIRRFASDRSGSTAMEYAIIATFIASAVIICANLMSGYISTVYARVMTLAFGG